MSGAPTDISLVAEPGQGRDGALPRNAQIYFIAVAITAAAVTLPFIGRLQTTHQWPAFLILASAAAIARLFVVRTPADQAYHTDIVFLIPAALILPPELLVLVAVVQMVPEWLKMRYRWYLQTFNILDYSLSAMAAWFVGRWLILEHAGIANNALRLSMAGLAACIVFVAVNHVLLAVMLRLARGFTLRETGLFDAEYVATDLVLAALGVAVYAFWETNPWLVPFALTPLFLIHRSLSVPALQAEARVDPKTGLFNARHFAAALSEEIGRARRFERPMSLIMADLDLLRDINNTYGHLAGDAVLKGIAEVFRAQLRHYDVPARFGGEEFSILLPETPPDQALEIAERIRRAVAERTFDVETSSGADPGNGLDRSRRLPEGRHRRERAHPPGRPRRVPRQAAGTKPRPRRELRAAARARRSGYAFDRGAGGRRPPRAASGRAAGTAPGGTSRSSTSTPARGPRPALPVARPPA